MGASGERITQCGVGPCFFLQAHGPPRHGGQKTAAHTNTPPPTLSLSRSHGGATIITGWRGVLRAMARC